jgi:hypothetical protein
LIKNIFKNSIVLYPIFLFYHLVEIRKYHIFENITLDIFIANLKDVFIQEAIFNVYLKEFLEKLFHPLLAFYIRMIIWVITYVYIIVRKKTIVTNSSVLLSGLFIIINFEYGNLISAILNIQTFIAVCMLIKV